MSEAVYRQPFMHHIQELRGRLAWCIVALLVGTTIGYFIKDQLLAILVKPLGQTLYYTSPGGGFSLMIQLCLGFGIVFAVPVFIFHIIRFLAPVLPNYSLRLLITILFSSCVLLSLGVLFAYFVSLPAALYFLNEFSNDQVQALISTDTYMSFVTLYLAGFAVLFQLPLLILIVNGVQPLTPKKLLANTKWVVLASFVVAALITPTPDPFNQAIMAGPIILLYVASAVPLKVVNRKRKPGASTAAYTVESQPVQPAPGKFDMSQIEVVKKQEAIYKGRKGEYYLWKFKDRRSNDTIVTFTHDGKQEFVKIYRQE